MPKTFADLVELMDRLRSPGGCPWDREQTYATLAPMLLEEKTQGNLDEQEAQMLENLLADLRMQYVSFAQSPTPPASKFSANDITGGK